MTISLPAPGIRASVVSALTATVSGTMEASANAIHAATRWRAGDATGAGCISVAIVAAPFAPSGLPLLYAACCCITQTIAAARHRSVRLCGILVRTRHGWRIMGRSAQDDRGSI